MKRCPGRAADRRSPSMEQNTSAVQGAFYAWTVAGIRGSSPWFAWRAGTCRIESLSRPACSQCPMRNNHALSFS